MQRIETSSGALFAGAAPSLDIVKRINPDLIWNLARELAPLAKHQERFAKQVLVGNIEDFKTPSDVPIFMDQLEHVLARLRQNEKVIVHCYGGHGRTGMALAFILMKLNNIPAEQALELTKKLVFGPETIEQIEFVKSSL